MRYLLISILFCVVSCTSYIKKNNYTNVAVDSQLVKNAYFSNQEKDYVYKAKINVYNNYFGGVFIVPLYALVQIRAKPEFRARVIAVINIVNALFMVLSAIFAMLLLGIFEVGIPKFFAILAIMNIVVIWYLNRRFSLP